MKVSVPINAAKQTMEIIDILGSSNGLTLSELATDLDMPRSTVHDYLQTLMKLDYVEHHENGYHLSTHILEIGTRRRLQMEIYRTAKSELIQLADETEEHVTLVTEEHGMGVLLDTVMGAKAVEVFANDGTRTYLHTTAPGKAILAHMPEERRNAILDSYNGDDLPAFTNKTLTDREELFDEFEDIRDRGYAFDRNEALDGMQGVGAPIIRRNKNTVVGAVSVYAPQNRITVEEFEKEISELLLQTTNVIEINLTYS